MKLSVEVYEVQRKDGKAIRVVISWGDRQIFFSRDEGGTIRETGRTNLSGARLHGIGEEQLSFPPAVYDRVWATAMDIFSEVRGPKKE